MILAVNYPQRKAEIMAFVRRHHYTRRCPGVWSVTYIIEDSKSNKVKVALIIGPPPYPSIARSFVFGGREYEKKVAWQARLIAQGVTSAELDQLLQFANTDLLTRGFWWVLTFTDPNAYTIDDFAKKVICKGYTGEIYHRNGFLHLGTTANRGKKGAIAAWIIDDKEIVHTRQGAVTLTQANIKQHYPSAKKIRCVRALPKQRWVYVLAATELERAERVRLMRYHPQVWESVTQPRMFVELQRLLFLSSKVTPNILDRIIANSVQSSVSAEI